MAHSRLLFSEHALDRLLDWDVSETQVEAVLADGQTVEEYEDGARLVLGWSGPRPFHVVVADRASGTSIVVTLYEPDPSRWDAAFRERIRR
ncbi:MAG: DUF4258 domain-containing protein [Acidimicrobiales bacterium]